MDEASNLKLVCVIVGADNTVRVTQEQFLSAFILFVLRWQMSQSTRSANGTR